MSDATDVPFDDIQNACYALFIAAPAITGTVYDEVDENESWPYTILGEPSDTPMEARGVKGRIVIVPFEVFSRGAGGKQEVYTIMSEIVVKLTAAKLTMTNWSEIWKTFNAGRVVREQKEGSPLVFRGTVTMLISVAKK
jgi:hypothetical protein